VGGILSTFGGSVAMRPPMCGESAIQPAINTQSAGRPEPPGSTCSPLRGARIGSHARKSLGSPVWLTSRGGLASPGDLFGNKHVGLMSAYQLSVVMPASTIGPQ
jgi:hypothetical protein